MDTSFLGILFLLGTIFLARNMQRKSISLLNSDQKAILFDIGMKKNKIQFAVLIGWFLVYLMLNVLLIMDFRSSSILFFMGLAIITGIRSYSQYQKYKSSEFPAEFLKSYQVSSLITVTGILVYAILRLTSNIPYEI